MPVPVQHPHWCDGVDCTVTGDPYQHGFHWSVPAHLEPDPRTAASATVRIAQGTPVRGQTESSVVLVDLTICLPAYDPTDADEQHTLILGGERAIALGRMLLSAGREATR